MSQRASVRLKPEQRAVLAAIQDATADGAVLRCGQPDTNTIAERLDVTLAAVRRRTNALAERGLVECHMTVRTGDWTTVRVYALTGAAEEVLDDGE